MYVQREVIQRLNFLQAAFMDSRTSDYFTVKLLRNVFNNLLANVPAKSFRCIHIF